MFLLKLQKEQQLQLLVLLEVENPDNPVEIVIHVNVLKEGWDVNNLFTIIPLNAAKSDILAMQTIHLNEEKRLFLELFISLMRLAYMRNIKDLKKWSENIAAMGREQQKRFLEYCQHMIRENFIFNFHRGELNYMNREERNFSVRFAPFINERNVIKLMNELAEAQVHIEQNVNANMVFFDLTLKTIMLLKQ